MRYFALAGLLIALAAHADVYRWTDQAGVVHYADKPLVSEAKPVVLPTLQTYRAGSPPASASNNPADPQALAQPMIGIRSPAAGEIIADADGKMTIEVVASPAGGQGIVYYLDGIAQNKTPTLSTALLVTAIQPGDHVLGAALVDADGHQLARAVRVKIVVKSAPH